MASLFSAANLRDIITGKPKLAAAASPPNPALDHDVCDLQQVDYHKPVGHSRHGQRATRQRGEGSWDFVTSSDLAENDTPHTRAEGQATEAYPVRNEASEVYSALSEELDSMKDDIDRLKKQADLEFEIQKLTPKSSYAGPKKVKVGRGSIRCKVPVPSQKSATAHPKHAPENKYPKAPTTGDQDMPGASSSDKASKKQTHRARKLAVNAAANAGDHPAPKASSSASLAGSLSRHPANTQQGTKHSSTSPGDQPAKHSPHFAQPTVAASIRRESVRRDSTLSTGVTTPDGSPKSFQPVVPRKPKRATLPGAWADPTNSQTGTHAHIPGPAIDVSTAKQPSEPQVGRDTIKEEQSLRKKPSTSYMSPTKATTLRNIATIGQEDTKRTSPRLSHSRPLSRVTTVVSPVEGLKSAGSVVSDSESERIITEMNTNIRSSGRPLSRAANWTRPIPGGSQSPTGIIPSELRRRMTVSTSVAEALAQHAKYNGLPNVENTTRKRRESSGDLLNPIRARLNKVGLLADGISEGKAFHSGAPPMAMRVVREQVSQSPTKTEATPKAAFQPPHRRLWVAKAAPEAKAVPAASSLSLSDKGAQTMPKSLRATAVEFTPMPKPQAPIYAPMTPISTVHNWDTALKFYTASEWDCLSAYDKRVIMAARHYHRHGELPFGRKVAMQENWQALMSQVPVMSPGPSPSYADVFGPGVVAGQIIKPHQIPGSDGVRWTVQGRNGEEAPLDFSPRSDDTSPRQSPTLSPNSWTIGADESHRKTFGWTGGAGREIRFVGYGPDAERDPTIPVSFNFRGGNSRPGRAHRNETGPHMIGQEWYPEVPLAPRSKEQWARLKGYEKVPCSDVNLTHAYEMLPHPGDEKLAGFCNDCSSSSH